MRFGLCEERTQIITMFPIHLCGRVGGGGWANSKSFNYCFLTSLESNYDTMKSSISVYALKKLKYMCSVSSIMLMNAKKILGDFLLITCVDDLLRIFDCY